MKTFLLFLIAFLLATGITIAQDHSKYMKQGEEFFGAKDFISALGRFELALDFASTEPEKNKARSWKNKCIEKIKQQQDDLKKALAKAEEMQTKVETAMFDKSVKERFNAWKGFDHDYAEDPEDILARIDTLDLSSNALLRLPKEITYCLNLRSLNLIDNANIDWKDCFKKLEKCGQLSDLKISIEDLTDIDSRNWKYITGVKLVPVKNRNSVPKEIFKLKQLKYLDLSKSNLIEISNDLANLTNLETLDLQSNQIKSLPHEIGKLKNLKKLYLNNNQLTTLPSEFGFLNNLSQLNLENNKLSDIPGGFENLVKIVSVNLSNNYLSSIPKSLASLTEIKYLDLSKNKIEIIQGQLANLKNLLELNLAYNQLKLFPPEIPQLDHIEQINISNNRIVEIPGQVQQLQNLKRLDLSFNRISNVPQGIKEMQKLKDLNLIGNDIRIPETDTTMYMAQNVGYGFDFVQVKEKQIKNPDAGLNTSQTNVKKLNATYHGSKRDSTIAIVIHYSAVSYNLTINAFTKSDNRASVHYVIDRNGQITQLLDNDLIAYHLGSSEFNGIKNSNSVSIELVNAGYLKESGKQFVSWYGESIEPGDVIQAIHKNETSPRYWQKYTQEQIETTYLLCKELIQEYPGIKYILGNDEIKKGRKLDPGPAFPIDQLREDLGLSFNSY